MLDPPDPDALATINDVTAADLPRFAVARQERDHPAVEDLEAATVDALDTIPGLADLESGATVGITAGSRGIHDMPDILRIMVAELQDRGLDPFIFPAMGSHGGATAEGQREMLASLDITEETMGCEIRSSIAVEEVATDDDGRPVYAAVDALEADAVIVANRVKAHTDFHGDIESGLCKMTVIGIGKQRGADAAHNAALATSFREVLPDRAGLLFDAVPILGGVAVIENANEHAAEIVGVPVDEIIDREPALLERSLELLPTLPIDDLDLLIVDRIGKNYSGTGMDTNVVGRMLMHGEPEFETPSYSRIYTRGLTEASHGNAIGIGLADYVHQSALSDVTLTDTYVNAVTGGEPARARIPVVCPTDELAFSLVYSTTGVRDASDLRVAWVPNTLELSTYAVSEPVAAELRERPDVTLDDLEPLTFTDGDLATAPFRETPIA